MRRTIVVTLPLLVVLFLRVNKEYEHEDTQLVEGVPDAATAPVLNRHVVLVFVDTLDLAAARAVQYARTLTPDELRAVHFAIDPMRAEELSAAWSELGLSRVTLDLVDCRDRRLTRAAVELVARHLADGQTEVSVLLPDRKYRGFWHRILHDRTADAIERAVSQLAHANVTTVPFHFSSKRQAKESVVRPTSPPARTPADIGSGHIDATVTVEAPDVPASTGVEPTPRADGVMPIAKSNGAHG